jgi:probable HAF family extracellular repeat protein
MQLRKSALVASSILLGLLANSALAADGGGGWPKLNPIDLGTLGGMFSQASGVDAFTNHIAGSSSLTNEVAIHAVVWDGHSNAITDLGVLSGGTNSSAAGVTSHGVATGTSDYLDSVYGLVQRAFLYKNSNLTMIGTLGGSQSYGTGINESNQVAGYATTANDATTHGFFYDSSSATLRDLGTLIGAGGNSAAFALNNFGGVGGSSDTGKFDGFGNPITDAVIWSVGKTIHINDLGNLSGGTYAQVNALNNFGVATGFSTLASGQSDAFVYFLGQMINIGTLGGSAAQGLGINDLGVVVGYSNTTGDAGIDAFLWSAFTGMIDLNSLLPAGSPWVLLQASGINDEGRIVGYGLLNGEYHAFIL